MQQRVRDPNYKISLTALEYFFKLKALLSEGNQYGVEAHTLYNLIYVQLLRYYERLFVEPKTVRRISAKDAVLAEIKRRRIGVIIWYLSMEWSVLYVSGHFVYAPHGRVLT